MALKETTYDDINAEIYACYDEILGKENEEDYDSEEDFAWYCASKAIDEVIENLRCELEDRWGVNNM